MNRPPKNATYLHDGVYVSFDGYQFWLWTQRSFDGWHYIALELQAIDALNAHVRRTLMPRETSDDK